MAVTAWCCTSNTASLAVRTERVPQKNIAANLGNKVGRSVLCPPPQRWLNSALLMKWRDTRVRGTLLSNHSRTSASSPMPCM